MKQSPSSPLFTQGRLPSAILFDNDGVLVASEPLHWGAWQKLLEDLKLPFDEEEVRKLVGKTGPEIISALLDQYRPGWDKTQFDVHALAFQKNNYYLANLSTQLKPYPGVMDGLKWVKSQGIATAVVSNAKRRELEASLKATGLIPWLDQLFSRDDLPQPKPDPMAYVTAAVSLNIEPSQCVVVEDSPPGLESALLAKIPAVAVATNFSREVLESPVLGRVDLKPSWVCSSMEDFFDRLSKLSRN